MTRIRIRWLVVWALAALSIPVIWFLFAAKPLN